MKKTVEYVTAYKGQLTQRFTRTSWEVMGMDKCGWALVPEVPKEVLDKYKNMESKEAAEMRSELIEIPSLAPKFSEAGEKAAERVQSKSGKRRKKR